MARTRLQLTVSPAPETIQVFEQLARVWGFADERSRGISRVMDQFARSMHPPAPRGEHKWVGDRCAKCGKLSAVADKRCVDAEGHAL